jgi:hypothetical protein
MANLSFGYTAAEYLARRKTVTRRKPTPRTVKMWQRAWDERPDFLHTAYASSPRVGGDRIGQLRLTARPYVEPLGEMPEEHLLLEGGTCESREEFFERYFENYDLNDPILVIPFEPFPNDGFMPGAIVTVERSMAEPYIILEVNTIATIVELWPNPNKRPEFTPMATCLGIEEGEGGLTLAPTLASFPLYNLVPTGQFWSEPGFDPRAEIERCYQRLEAEWSAHENRGQIALDLYPK